ncbi:DNA repair protein Rev1 [Episyrphus balteatus]|uniref:DNA repair protein Rev1 n=1 Tax=Episyrphus balteatus TaxID=286459 RepID=UPI002485CEDC|nr:DNA repair protein Rev1 [Episyrphus balteatus]
MANNGFDEWGGYMEAKITKLEEQFVAASNPFRQTNLFSGISIFVNGHTNPSADELKRIMMVHGGIFHMYERSHTTYIIAANLPDVKVRNMNTSKIISAQWVVDCLKEQKIVDYTKYLLYNNQNKSQPRISFGRGVHKKKEEAKETSKIDEKEVASILKDLENLNAKMKRPSETIVKPDKPPDESVKPETSIVSTSRGPAPDKSVQQPPEPNVKPDTSIASTSRGLATDKPVQQPSEPSVKADTSTASTSRGLARTAVDPKFLSEFYNNSRLHHIATLGAGFKQYVSDLRETSTGLFPDREQLQKSLPRAENFVKKGQIIMHIDMDCFFVSVGLRSHPYLRGQPIAVTHSKGGGGDVPVHPGADRKVEMDLFTKKFENQLHNNILSDKVRGAFEGKQSLSEIASCSYEAREKGIRNGMFVGHALKLCPNLKTIPYDFEGYREVAYTLYNTIAMYTLDIEAVSCDEMFVNLTDLINELQVDPMDFVTHVRQEVRDKTSCPCSAGVGENKLQARMATKKAKPDGQYYLGSDKVEEYMASIPIRDLPGVGSSTMYTLEEMKLATCGDLQAISLSKIQAAVGKKFGETLYQFCRGIDPRPLAYGQIRKSVSAEVNYGIRFKTQTELETFLRQLCTEVHTRLTNIKRKGKCITLKLMVRAKEAPVETSKFMGHGVCDNLTKAVSLSDYTCDLEVITRTVLATTKALNVPPNELRGIGIQITKLDEPNEPKEKKENVIKNMFSKVAEKQQDKPPKAQEVVAKVEDKSMKVEEKSNEKKSTGAIPKVKTKGRPRKKPPKMPDVMGMLKSAAANKRPVPSTTDLPDGIDATVFAELPDDIRNEILRDHARKQARTAKEQPSPRKKPAPISPSKMEEEFLRAMPPELQMEVQMQIGKTFVEEIKPPPPPTSISPENIFHQQERIQLLLEWVKSSTEPENYDIELICEHATEYVRAKKIHDLYDPLVYLCRIINRFGSCGWHTAYNVIIDAIQNQMRLTYGHKLYLSNNIECKKCWTL